MSSKLFPDLSFLDSYKPHHYIFYNNRVLTHRIIAYHMRPIYNDLFNQGLEHNDYKYRMCNHVLRHTMASHLAINGNSIFQIQKLLNHKDLKATARYSKLSNENKMKAIEGLY